MFITTYIFLHDVVLSSIRIESYPVALEQSFTLSFTSAAQFMWIYAAFLHVSSDFPSVLNNYCILFGSVEKLKDTKWHQMHGFVDLITEKYFIITCDITDVTFYYSSGCLVHIYKKINIDVN